MSLRRGGWGGFWQQEGQGVVVTMDETFLKWMVKGRRGWKQAVCLKQILLEIRLLIWHRYMADYHLIL